MAKYNRDNIKERTLTANVRTLAEFHANMFEYENLPETLLSNYLEEYLQHDGQVAIFRCTEAMACSGFNAGDLICGECSTASKDARLNPYGEGIDVIAKSRNGQQFTFDRYGNEGVLGFNNLSETPLSDINLDALKLTEIDISLDFMIFWTRLAPLIKVSDEKQKEIVRTAFSAMVAGEPLTVVGKSLLSDLGIESESISVESLTEPELADKIQFTARLREDILRWHYTRYGQVIQGDTKMAQQSVDEVNGTVSSSLIIPLGMLKARRAMVEEINKKFGTNIEVKLSGAWRAEVTKYENMSGEPEIDETDTDELTDEPETENTEPETSEPENESEVVNNDETN